MVQEQIKYYLVEGTVSKTPYMGDTLKFKSTRLVIACDESEAKVKYEGYWKSKSDPYVTSYWAECEVLETIS